MLGFLVANSRLENSYCNSFNMFFFLIILKNVICTFGVRKHMWNPIILVCIDSCFLFSFPI